MTSLRIIIIFADRDWLDEISSPFVIFCQPEFVVMHSTKIKLPTFLFSFFTTFVTSKYLLYNLHDNDGSCS